MYDAVERRFANVANWLGQLEQRVAGLPASSTKQAKAKVIYVIAAETFALFAAVYHAFYLAIKAVPSATRYVINSIVPDLELKDYLWINHGKPFIFALTILVMAVPVACFKKFSASTTLKHQLEWLSGRIPPPPKDYSKIFWKYARMAGRYAPNVIRVGIVAAYGVFVFKLFVDAGVIKVPPLSYYLPFTKSCFPLNQEWVTDSWGNGFCSEEPIKNRQEREWCTGRGHTWKLFEGTNTGAGKCNEMPKRNLWLRESCEKKCYTWTPPVDDESLGSCDYVKKANCQIQF